MKSRRHELIKKIISEEIIETQEALAEALRARLWRARLHPNRAAWSACRCSWSASEGTRAGVRGVRGGGGETETTPACGPVGRGETKTTPASKQSAVLGTCGEAGVVWVSRSARRGGVVRRSAGEPRVSCRGHSYSVGSQADRGKVLVASAWMVAMGERPGKRGAT